jgi:YVTN family beta-propeller protein
MALRICRLLAVAFVVSRCLASGGSFAQTGQNFYITNFGDNTVSTFTDAYGSNATTIPVGKGPGWVAVSRTTAYVANSGDGTVSVIDIATNTNIATINVSGPVSIAVSPDGSKVYVVSGNPNCPFISALGCVVVIDAATNTVTDQIECTKCSGITVSPDGSKYYVSTIDGWWVSVFDTATNTLIGGLPTSSRVSRGIAASPDGKRLYVASSLEAGDLTGTITVIDLTTGADIATIPLGTGNPQQDPAGIAVSPGSGKVYVATVAVGVIDSPSILWVIDTVTNKVIRKIFVGDLPAGVAISTDGTIYVVSSGENHIDVIDPLTYTVFRAIPVGNSPIAFGNFIQAAPLFAGTPGQPNCVHVSIASLLYNLGGRLSIAARALGFPTVLSLRSAINAFCNGSHTASR